MRFMILVKGDKRTEAGVLPTEEELAAMGRYNDELIKAGVMLAGEGLQATAKGAKVTFPERRVIDGPFTEAKEVVCGYWIWQVRSKEEAIEWLKRAPFSDGEVEIRQIFEPQDFEMSAETRGRYEDQKARL